MAHPMGAYSALISAVPVVASFATGNPEPAFELCCGGGVQATEMKWLALDKLDKLVYSVFCLVLLA